jgi:peptide/nickel transport system ATP-binding protein
MISARAVDAHGLTIGSALNRRRLVVRDVSFAVPVGGSVGIVGESGCGKTSVVQALFGYTRSGLQPLAGTVTYLTTERATESSRALSILEASIFASVRGRTVALVPQSAQSMLDPIMTVGDQIAEVLGSSQVRKEFIRGLLRDVGFPQPERVMSRFPHQLSGGQRQRIAISMAIALSPDVLVLDEATSDLDVITQNRILTLIKDLQRERGFALISVSHDLRVLRKLCSDLLVLYAGRVVEAGSIDDILRNPRHPYTSSLVSRFARGPLGGSLRVAGDSRLGHAEAGCAYLAHCALATSECAEEPHLITVSPGHSSRCWHHSEVRYPDELRDALPGAHSPINVKTDLLQVFDLHASHREPGLVARKRFNVLYGVTFEIAPRECLGVVGESGSGKTTLARVIAGLHKPDGGTLAYLGRPLEASASSRALQTRKGIQIVFQNPESAFNPRLSVRDVLRRRVRMFEGASGSRADARLDDLLQSVGLPTSYLDRRPSQLSGGERQRLAIARALIGDPRLLICDEVVSALDVETQARVVQLLHRLQRERDLSYIFISHDISIVAAMAHRIMVLRSGHIVEIGETEQVLYKCREPYTRELIESAYVGSAERKQIEMGG